MTRADATAFASELAGLAEVFGEQVSQVRTQLYFEALSGLTLDEVRVAVRAAIRGCRFFPKPAELIELLHGSSEDQAETAWGRFLDALTHHGSYSSVDFGDPVLHAVIATQFGGWHETWKLKTDELRFAHVEFVKLYRAFRKTGRGAAGHCAGQHELQNLENGYLDAIPPPKQLTPPSSQKALDGTKPKELAAP